MLVQTIVSSKIYLLGSLLIFSAGCGEKVATIHHRQAPLTPVTQQQSPIVASIGSKSIRRDDLWPALVEIGGVEVIEDTINHLLLDAELTREGMSVSPQDISIERELLWTASPNLNTSAIEKMLASKGIGTFRQHRLLWRNAALRKLIKEDVVTSDDSVKRMFEIVYGPRYPTSVIVTATLEQANSIHSALQSGASFQELAEANSIDPSATRGGRVNPISGADPLWPSSIREQVQHIAIGSYSSPVFIGDRWVILSVTEEPILSHKTFEQVEKEVTHLAILAQERFLMEALLEKLQIQTQIDYFDKDLQRVLRSDSHNSQ